MPECPKCGDDIQAGAPFQKHVNKHIEEAEQRAEQGDPPVRADGIVSQAEQLRQAKDTLDQLYGPSAGDKVLENLTDPGLFEAIGSGLATELIGGDGPKPSINGSDAGDGQNQGNRGSENAETIELDSDDAMIDQLSPKARRQLAKEIDERKPRADGGDPVNIDRDKPLLPQIPEILPNDLRPQFRKELEDYTHHIFSGTIRKIGELGAYERDLLTKGAARASGGDR